MRYICRNCGNIQYDYGPNKSGCACTFWVICLIITIFIGLFAAVAWIVVGFEILFMILTRPRKINECFECKAKDCVVPLDTPAGKKIYTDFYGEEHKEENRFFKSEEEIEQSTEDKKKIVENEETENYILETPETTQNKIKQTCIWIAGFVLFVSFTVLVSIGLGNLTQPTEQKPKSPKTQEEKQMPKKSATKTPNQKPRLSIEEQSKDNKGIYLPLSEGAGFLIDDIVFSQIFVHDKFNIQVYFVDLKKYPKFQNNLIRYGEKIAETLSITNSEGVPKYIDIYIFSKAKDLYYLRNLPQTHTDIELELMKLQPILHIDYNPQMILSLCVKTPDGYKSKAKFINGEWSDGIACSYEGLKRMYDYWDKK